MTAPSGSPVGLWWAQERCYADARGEFEFIGWSRVNLVEVRQNVKGGLDIFGMGWDIPSRFSDVRLIRRVESPPEEVEFPVIK